MRLIEAVGRLAAVTADQWGMITTAQAGELGLDSTTLVRLREAGVLERTRRGVHAVAAVGAISHREEKAVWLALDPSRLAWQRTKLDRNSGVFSHRSAALLHGLGDLVVPKIEVIVPRRRRTRDSTIKLHRAELTADDVTLADGLPVTSVVRTILDLMAEYTDGSHLAQIIWDAKRGGRVDLDELCERAAPCARRYGAPSGDGFALVRGLLDHLGVASEIDEVRRLLAEQRRISAAIAEAIERLDPDIRRLLQDA